MQNLYSMNEIILVIIFLAILLGLPFLINRIKKPLVYYIRILFAIALLPLVWLFSEDGNIGLKIILSVLALTSLYRGYFSIKRFKPAK